jgi:hypothetical protein
MILEQAEAEIRERQALSSKLTLAYLLIICTNLCIYDFRTISGGGSTGASSASTPSPHPDGRKVYDEKDAMAAADSYLSRKDGVQVFTACCEMLFQI